MSQQATYSLVLNSEDVHDAIVLFAGRKLRLPIGKYQSTVERLPDGSTKISMEWKADQTAKTTRNVYL